MCCGMQENEDALEDWAESLTELSTMKTDLSQYVIADDVLLLQEQVEHLHRQWEELCLKVRDCFAFSSSTRTRQEIPEFMHLFACCG